jgi:insertion element IS1 protein InsB
MIEETITYSCRSCGSKNIIRNGHNKCGQPQYHCKDCRVYRVLEPHPRHPEAERKPVMQACRERMSLRGVERVFGVCRKTIMRWIEKRVAALPNLAETLLPASPDDVLEMDELVTFVSEKFFKRWLWLALCRRTRQIVAFAIGDRSQDTCRLLWQTVPSAYRICPIYTDYWDAYPLVLPPGQHIASGKSAGHTNHQERWNNTLRQWLGRYTRRTLSFSKADRYHELITRWFILEYNLAIRASLTM